MIVVLILVFGLIVGSFLNAVIYRLHARRSFVTGRSVCPACGHTLHVADLIPILSFLFLRGRCRYCRGSISWQYPIVEAVTAACFFAVWHVLSAQFSGFELGARFLFYAILLAFLVILFVYDLKYYLILDKVVVPAIVIAFIGNLIFGAVWWKLLLAAFVAGGFFAFQFFVSRGKWIGGGDIRLGVLMGVILSWPLILVALFVAYIGGSVIGIGLIMARVKQMGSKIPFGTFLTAATFITMLYGDSMLRWYLQGL